VVNPYISTIYYINGITHYSNFIYPNTSDLNSLHSILKSNPTVEARFSNIILQDIIKEYTEEALDITFKFLRIA
jgi:hypothetical protein